MQPKDGPSPFGVQTNEPDPLRCAQCYQLKPAPAETLRSLPEKAPPSDTLAWGDTRCW